MDETEAGGRLWTYLMGARLLVALFLTGMQAIAYAQDAAPWWLLLLCGVYLLATGAMLRWSRPARPDSLWARGWALTLWVDLAVFGVLQTFQPSGFNYTPLFVLPVLLASIMGPLLLALGSAAFATLVLLFDAFTSEVLYPGQASSGYGQGAITGAGLFLVALLANQLAWRLVREQTQARISRAWADAESQVNQLIVTGLSEGVMVIDAQGRLWHANSAACEMLGDRQAKPPYETLVNTPGWPLLSAWVRRSIFFGRDAHAEFTLPTPTGGERLVSLRSRISTTPGEHMDIDTACVVFMEDLHDVETRVRNEKLATMGRVSAALAHEIRNPLAAISQATALLREEPLTPDQQRLLHICSQNVYRLREMVEDILEVVKLPNRPRQPAPHLPLDETLHRILVEWNQQHPAGPEPLWQPGAPGFIVAFDAEHLRRVLVNLLDNARQHAPIAQDSLEVTTHPSGTVEVWNPGLPLPAQVAQHLFEPFTSSHSRSSGLGLYLSRELCERYGAQLQYRSLARHGVSGHAFTVRFPPVTPT